MTIEIARDSEVPGGEEILTDEALAFVEELHQRFDPRRRELLAARHERRERIAARRAARLPAGDRRRSATATGSCRPPPPALVDRRVEITGPATPAKMAINALNSGARVWLADLEDASSPTWANVVGSVLQPARRRARHPRLHLARGQGVRAAHRRAPPDGRHPAARLAPAREARARRRRARRRARSSTSGCTSSTPRSSSSTTATGRSTTCRSSRATSRRDSGTTCSCSRRSALGIPRGTIRATVLIETIPAAFEMDEILFELREHASGLNAGPVGLPVQHHQGVPRRRARVHRARPGRRVDDRAVHARLHRAAREDLPPPRRRRDGRHGRVRAEPRRPRGHGRRVREGARRQDPRGERRLRRLVGRPSRSRARSAARCSTRCSATGRTSSTGSGPRSRSPPPSCSTSPRPAARSPRRGCAPTSRSASPTRRPGSRAAARSPCTASWRMPRPPRSRARRCGSTCGTAWCSPTPGAR